MRTHAFEYAWEQLGDNHADDCPLKVAMPLSDEEVIEVKEAEASVEAEIVEVAPEPEEDRKKSDE